MTVSTLPDALRAAGMLAPDYGGQCLDGVLPAVAASLGGTGGGQAWRAAQQRLGVPDSPRVCVVLVDGLGRQMLEQRSGHAPFLRGRLGEARTLTVGYPTTTATSIGLFGTGCAAGRTGLLGYTVRNPRTRGLANLVSWQGADEPEQWQREPSVFELLTADGVPVTSVGPAKFAGSGLTRAALRGARYVAAESLADRVDTALYELTAPGLVYLYWGEVDTVGHHHGWQSPQWGDALAAADAELARLARSMPGGTTLLITADHGHVDVDPAALLDVASTPELARDVELVAGEPRACHVHTVPGTSAEVAQRWAARLGDAAVVARRDEALAAGWFGPVRPELLPMVGDVVVAATGRAGVVDSRTQTPHSLLLKGMHGSLTPGEMLVPLVVVH